MSQRQPLSMVVHTIFKECLFMVKSREDTVGYCLKFKLWNEPCPPNCDQYTPAPPGSLEGAREKKYDIDCLELSRKMNEKQVGFHCSLYEQPEPLCEACHFPRYMSGPFTPK